MIHSLTRVQAWVARLLCWAAFISIVGCNRNAYHAWRFVNNTGGAMNEFSFSHAETPTDGDWGLIGILQNGEDAVLSSTYPPVNKLSRIHLRWIDDAGKQVLRNVDVKRAAQAGLKPGAELYVIDIGPEKATIARGGTSTE